MDAKLGAKLIENKDIEKDINKDAILDAKLGTNKGIKKHKNVAKMDVKKDIKKEATVGILRNCTIVPCLAPDCSPQLEKNYTKISH